MRAVTATAAPPRIGLAGFFLEANRFAPVTTGATFAGTFDLAGDALLAELRRPASRALPDSLGFLAAMDAQGPWTAVPLRMAAVMAAGERRRFSQGQQTLTRSWWGEARRAARAREEGAREEGAGARAGEGKEPAEELEDKEKARGGDHKDTRLTNRS